MRLHIEMDLKLVQNLESPTGLQKLIKEVGTESVLQPDIK